MLENILADFVMLVIFFFLGQGGMTSWLDTFSNKKLLNSGSEKTKEASKTDSSSLDSRLSNLLQNIPNLPSSIFGNTSSGNNTPLHDSPLTGKKDVDSTTPIKDEYSGQNTPLQDEESTHSSNAFFQKISSNNKSKDILKNLTSLIQSASGEKTSDDSSKKEKYGYGSVESFDQGGGMSSFIKKIIPTVSQPSQSSSSSSFFNATQSAISTPVQTISVAQTSTASSFETSSFHDAPVYSSKPNSDKTEQLSFIPTLVPSMPQENFSYENYSTTEYNPELETFDTDMDVGNPIDDVIDESSPSRDSLSPVPSASLDEIPRSIGGRRLSTLITVVTKDSPENSLPSSEFPSGDVYKSDKENMTQDASWLTSVPQKVEDEWNDTVPPPESVADQISVSSPNEEFFIGKEASSLPPPFYSSVPPPPPSPLNGQNVPYVDTNVPPPVNAPSNLPLSKIETVQTHRDDTNGRWFGGNNWIENDRRPIPQILPPRPPPMSRGGPPNRFYDKRNFHPQQFSPRNNWVSRPNRPEKPFYRPYGPPQNKRFPFRGRGGRGRHFHQY